MLNFDDFTNEGSQLKRYSLMGCSVKLKSEMTSDFSYHLRMIFDGDILKTYLPKLL